jgi:hypothetical protein
MTPRETSEPTPDAPAPEPEPEDGGEGGEDE